MGGIFSAPDVPETAARARAVFIDKDGTLIEDVPYNVDPAKVRFTPRAMEGLRLLAARGYRLIVVTNQPGLAYGMFTRAALTRLQRALAAMMASEGVTLADFYACPHAPGPAGPVPGCLCRKPAPGLLRQAARGHALDLARCWMIGDILDDVEAGRRAGCRTVMLDVGHETIWRMSPLRTPHVRARDLLEAAQAIVAADEAEADGADGPSPQHPAAHTTAAAGTPADGMSPEAAPADGMSGAEAAPGPAPLRRSRGAAAPPRPLPWHWPAPSTGARP